MKLIITTLKPRNPLLVASVPQRAGAHRPCSGALRRKAKRQLQRALERANRAPLLCLNPSRRRCIFRAPGVKELHHEQQSA